MSDLLKELMSDPRYQKILEKLSDEERKLAEQGIADMFREFEEKIVVPLRNAKLK